MSANMEPDKFKYALKSNDAWASYKGHQNDTFFPNLAKGQAPEIRKSRATIPNDNQEPTADFNKCGLDAVTLVVLRPPSSDSNLEMYLPTETSPIFYHRPT
jgi:hypothetical protein